MDWFEFREKLRFLDPFTYSDWLLKRLGVSENGPIRFVAEVVTAFLSAWVLYFVIGLLLGTAMPLVVVVSGSMEPVLYRGDVVILAGGNADSIRAQEISVGVPWKNRAFADVGEVRRYIDDNGEVSLLGVRIAGTDYRFDTSGDTVVYFSSFSRDPIIHRAALKVRAPDGVFLLTKGDANPTFDQDCGQIVLFRPQLACITAYPVSTEDVAGKLIVRIPLIGYVKLLVLDDVVELVKGCPASAVTGEYCAYLKGLYATT